MLAASAIPGSLVNISRETGHTDENTSVKDLSKIHLVKPAHCQLYKFFDLPHHELLDLPSAVVVPTEVSHLENHTDVAVK